MSMLDDVAEALKEAAGTGSHFYSLHTTELVSREALLVTNGSYAWVVTVEKLDPA